MRVLHDGLDLTPAQTGWAISLARLQMETGDLAGADRTLIHSQPFAESNAEYAGFQGHLKSRLGEHRLAAEYYFRASRLAPREGRWWLGLGLAFEADGKVAESKEAFRRSLASGNLSPELAGVAEQRLR
jgi:MSHA biogenesis protein MshN